MSDLDDLHSFVADNSSPPGGASPSSPSPSPSPDLDELHSFVAPELQQEKYGTPGQMVKAGIEGAGRGISNGLSDQLFVKMNQINPNMFPDTAEDIKGRMEANPVTSFGTTAAGAGLTLAKTGIGAFGKALAGGSVAGALTLGGVEGAALGLGSAVTDNALGDQDLVSQKTLAQMGLGALIGVGTAGLGAGLKGAFAKTGLVKGSVANEIANEASDQASSTETKEALSDTSIVPSDNDEAIKAGQRLGLPTEPGMFSDNPYVQKANDALINGAPTYSGIKRAQMFADAYNGAVEKLNEVVPEAAPNEQMSKAEIGQVLQDNLSNKIQAESQPISRLYDIVKQTTKELPIEPNRLTRIANEVGDLERVQADPNAEKIADNFAKTAQKGIFQTVDGIKSLRKVMGDSINNISASPNEKYVISEIQDRLKELEESSIVNHAKNMTEGLSTVNPETRAMMQPIIDNVNSLLEQKKAADALYKPFISKIQTLAERLGKKQIYGPQSAINFIQNDLNPEDLTNRLFAKGKSQFLDFFANKFPEEAELMRQYQKQVLRESANKTGTFSPKVFFNKVNALEPEYQRAIFNPDELSTIKDSEKYIRGLPKNFNPSGTEHMSAFREFFKSPTGAMISNARDFGIDQFIKMAGKMPDGMRPNPIELGAELAPRFQQMNAVRSMAEKTDARVNDYLSNIFMGTARSVTQDVPRGTDQKESYEDRVKRLNLLSSDGEAMVAHLQNHTQGLDTNMPNVSQGIATGISNITNFLQSKIPKPNATIPLPLQEDAWQPSKKQKQQFEEYYDTVADPVGILGNIKEGTLKNTQIEAVTATHPSLMKEMQLKASALVNSSKAQNLPTRVKNSLSLFLQRPLTTGTIHGVVVANQLAQQNTSQSQQAAQAPGRKSGSTLGGLKELKVSQRAQTGTQKLEETQV